jgi:hypothetical protein
MLDDRSLLVEWKRATSAVSQRKRVWRLYRACWSAGVVDGSGLEMDRRRGANSSKLALHASRYHADEP